MDIKYFDPATTNGKMNLITRDLFNKLRNQMEKCEFSVQSEFHMKYSEWLTFYKEFGNMKIIFDDLFNFVEGRYIKDEETK
jgi:hypothetical protein